MKLLFLFVVLGVILAIIALFAVVSVGADMLRRRNATARDATVIADSGTEFEADVGKPPPGP